MDEPTRSRLLALNRDFYEREAGSFSVTRDHPWPGWQRVLDALVPAATDGPGRGVAGVGGLERARGAGCVRVLDAGCGNGRLAHFLLERGPRLHYVGIDASRALVAAARAAAPDTAAADAIAFEVVDLIAEPDALPAGPFDLVAAFGLLHHVPGFETRIALLERLGARLAPRGRLAATFWRFGSETRFASRVQPWSCLAPPLAPDALEPGDHLLRWGEAQDVVRYCHFADEREIARVVERLRGAGLVPLERFQSDGRSGSLNEYVVWGRDDARDQAAPR